MQGVCVALGEAAEVQRLYRRAVYEAPTRVCVRSRIKVAARLFKPLNLESGHSVKHIRFQRR